MNKIDQLNIRHAKKALEYSEGLPDNARGLYQRVVFKERSFTGAIKAKCQHCVAYEDTVDRIRYCSTVICPLWAYRPYQIDAESLDSE